MNDRELKPCPFCGSAGLLEENEDHHGKYFSLGCSKIREHHNQRNCIGSWVFYTESIKETPISSAISLWNTRAELGKNA